MAKFATATTKANTDKMTSIFSKFLVMFFFMCYPPSALGGFFSRLSERFVSPYENKPVWGSSALVCPLNPKKGHER